MTVRRLALAASLTFLAAPSYASGADDPVVSVAFALAVILASAKIFGHIAEVLGQPAVLGELIAGIVLGVVGRTLVPALDEAAKSPLRYRNTRVDFLEPDYPDVAD